MEAGSAAESRRARIQAAGVCLAIDLATVEVVSRLRECGVRVLLLKGPAIASWLYDPGELRPYVDCDLLVDREDLDMAAAALGALGFARLQDDRLGEPFSEPHAITWRRARDGVMVDLHWRIPGVAADPALAWRRLAAGAEPVTVAGTELEALALPARALQVALHAIQHGRLGERSMSDLARGVERIELAIWRSAVTLARELEALIPFTAGLRLDPGGAALADRLELPSELPERWRLYAQTPPAGVLRLHELLTVPGVRGKAGSLRMMLIPPPAYVRGLYPEARSGPIALAHAYARRALAGLRSLPGAARSLRRVRRSSHPGC